MKTIIAGAGYARFLVASLLVLLVQSTQDRVVTSGQTAGVCGVAKIPRACGFYGVRC